jgi:4-hydroxybenzoate polyprenyltransferase
MMHLNGKGSVFINWLRLLRWPNLLMIILTQYLLAYCVIAPRMPAGAYLPMGHLLFALLVTATVLIAAGGYIINDHYDVNTDRKNKAGKNMLDGRISVRKALRTYYVINGVAVALGFYLASRAGSFQLGLIFPAIAGLLWFYSSRYQRMLLWGNLIIAVITAMVVLVVWLFNFVSLLADPAEFVETIKQLGGISRYVWAYFLFAFLLSMIREMLKDMQDLKGDTASGYRTLPIVWGVAAARLLTAMLVFLSMVLLAFAQWFLFSRGLMLLFWYGMLVLQPLMAYLLFLLARHGRNSDYGLAAGTAKVIMLAGILSMQLLCLI